MRLPSIVPPERIKPEAPVAPPVNPLVPPAVPPAKVQLPIKPAKLLVAAVVLDVAILVLANAGLIPFHEFDKPQFEVNSRYIGPAPHKKPTAVVFVHGIFGTKKDTWLNGANNTSFPALLGADPEFQKQIDIFVFEYFTPKFGNAGSIVDLADQLRGSLDDKRIFEDHQKVVFFSHSMGGLIVRQFLLNKRERLAQVSMLYFYATPTNGSELTTIAKQLSTNPQLRGMLPLEGNDLLQSIQSNWLGWEDVKENPIVLRFRIASHLWFQPHPAQPGEFRFDLHSHLELVKLTHYQLENDPTQPAHVVAVMGIGYGFDGQW